MNEAIKKEMEGVTGGRYRLFQVAVISSSLLLASIGIAGLLLGDLGQEYADSPAWLLQGFVTIPTIGSMIGNWLCGSVANKTGKKNLCIISLILILVGGLGPMVIQPLAGKIAVRVLAAMGIGFLQPLAGAIIIDYFDDKTSQTMMGIQGAFVGLGATLFSATMGAIMTYDWHFAYFAYLYAVPVLLLVIFGFPAFVNNKYEAPMETEAEELTEGSKVPRTAYLVMLISFIYSLGYIALTTCLSMAAVEVGTVTTVQAASIMSIAGVAGLIGGVLFGAITGAIGLKKIGPLGAIITFAGLLLIGISKSFMLWTVGSCLINVGFGWWMPFISFLITEGTDASNTAKATGLGYLGYSAGNFLFSWVLAGVGLLVGGISNHGAFIFAAVCVAIAIVILMFYLASQKKAQKN